MEFLTSIAMFIFALAAIGTCAGGIMVVIYWATAE